MLRPGWKGAGHQWPDVPHAYIGGMSKYCHFVSHYRSIIMELLSGMNLQFMAVCAVLCFLHSINMDRSCISHQKVPCLSQCQTLFLTRICGILLIGTSRPPGVSPHTCRLYLTHFQTLISLKSPHEVGLELNQPHMCSSWI